MTKLLSIIIPTYNRATRITKALNSIPERDDIEIIVVDDCSTDSTLEVLNNFDRDLIILRTEKNSGPGAARNKGLDVAKGDYVIFLDSDDWLVTDNLSKALNEIDDNTYDIIWFKNKLLGGGNWRCSNDKLVFQGQLVKRSLIGNTRYDTNLKWEEDQKFTKEIKSKHYTEKSYDFDIYVYDQRPGSKTKEEDTLTYKYLSTHNWHY